MAQTGIPGYRIIKTIGKGGMSRVYLAVQESVGRMIAIKVLSRKVSEDAGFTERFLKEANCGVLNHQNIITIYDAGESNGHLYIAMEYLQGSDLKQKIRQGISEKDTIRILSQIANALSFAHKNNFIHRDIKPCNILFDENNNAVLADFGIAKAVRFRSEDTTNGTFVGTPNYVSPEQVSDKAIDHRADLYSLGIVYFEMLTGKKPFTAESPYALIFQHLEDPVPELDEAHKHHQPIINKLLEKDPEKRYQTSDDLLHDLNNLHNLKTEPDNTPKTSHTFRNTSILFILLIAFASVAYIQLNTPPELPQEPTAPPAYLAELETIRQLQNRIKTESDKNRTLEIKKQRLETISSHFTKASRYIKLDQYVSPTERSALYEYNQILKLDKDNIPALTGILSIIDHYILLALTEKDKKNFSNSLQSIQLGLVADENNKTLLDLHKEITITVENKKIYKNLKKEMSKANKLIYQGEYNKAKKILESLKKSHKNNWQVKSRLAKVNKIIKKKNYISSQLKASTEILSTKQITEINLDQACENIHRISLLEPDDEKILSAKQTCAHQYLLLARQSTPVESSIELAEKGMNYDPESSEISEFIKSLANKKTDPVENQGR